MGVCLGARDLDFGGGLLAAAVTDAGGGLEGALEAVLALALGFGAIVVGCEGGGTWQSTWEEQIECGSILSGIGVLSFAKSLVLTLIIITGSTSCTPFTYHLY